MANTHDSHGGGHGGHGGGDHPSVEILSQMGYEQRDVSLPALRNWLIGFIVFLTLMLSIPYGIYRLVVPTFADELHQPMRHQRRVPPFPQIQPDPKPDMMVYRAAEDRVLSGQAAMPNDKPGISIDQAIDQLATRQGISGVTGTAQKALDPNSNQYPGGGDYSKSVNAANPPRTTPGGVPPAPMIQGMATNPTVKTTAGVGDTAGGTPGVGAPGAVSGTPNPGAPTQGAPTPEAPASGTPAAGAATTP